LYWKNGCVPLAVEACAGNHNFFTLQLFCVRLDE